MSRQNLVPAPFYFGTCSEDLTWAEQSLRRPPPPAMCCPDSNEPGSSSHRGLAACWLSGVQHTPGNRCRRTPHREPRIKVMYG